MIQIFREVAGGIKNRFVNEWVKKDKKVVGYTCSFMPPEVLFAAGILPYRIKGIETSGMEIGDSYYGPYVCTFPKCLLQLAGEGKYDFLSGAVISTGCDAMRRLDECWRKLGEDYEGALPEFFHYFDVPHKIAPHSMEWFEDEIKNLISRVESNFSVSITEDKLREAIEVYNKGRELLWEVEKLRTSGETVISGADAFSIAVASTAMPMDIFNESLTKFLKEAKNNSLVSSGKKKRIMIAGSINDDIDLVKLIEDSGAIVVADNICFGTRNAVDRVDSGEEPVKALANRYLSDSVCPRMFGAYPQRLEYLKEKVERAGVEGVVLQNIRFCDLHGSENGLMEKDLEKMGIPCLRLEREYGPLTETGRLKMRIEAFFERI